MKSIVIRPRNKALGIYKTLRLVPPPSSNICLPHAAHKVSDEERDVTYAQISHFYMTSRIVGPLLCLDLIQEGEV